MKEIPLTKGLVALVDDEDFDAVGSYKWHASRSHALSRKKSLFYACRSEGGKKVYMHRVLSGALEGQLCDHRDGDSLNNRRGNLRIATRSQNAINRGGIGTSRYLGVCWVKTEKKWRAQIQVNKKKQYLGTFDSEEEAAMRYNEAAIEAFGEFVRLNVV